MAHTLNPPFIHLHSHFWGSYSDSAMSVEQGLDRAVELGQPAMAITDHGEIAFAPRFRRACADRGIRPILGVECYFVEDAFVQIERDDERRHHLILLAKDDRGYQNLVRLMNDAWLERCFRGQRGLVDWTLLEKYHEGLICLSACYYGSFPMAIIRGGHAAGERELARYLDLFGDDFYPEMSRIGFEEQEIANEAIAGFARSHGLKPVATNDVHYPLPGDWIAHDIVTKTRFGRVSDFDIGTRDIWMKSGAEMRALGFDREHLAATWEVAEKCAAGMPPGPVSPPVVGKSPGTDLSRLRKMCAERASGGASEWEGLLDAELRFAAEKGLAGCLLAAAGLASRLDGAPRALPGGGGGTATAFLLGLSDIRPRPRDAGSIEGLSRLVLSCPDPGSARRLLGEMLGQDSVCRAAELVPIGGGDALRFTAEVLNVPAEEREAAFRDIAPAESVEANLSISPHLAALCAAHPEVARWSKRIEGIPRRSRPSDETLILTRAPSRDVLPMKRDGDEVFCQYDAEGARLAGFLTLDLWQGQE